MAQFKYLIKVEPGANNNKFYKMSENSDGTFTAEYGRVGATKPAQEVYPMEKWDTKLREKLSSRKGYEDKTELFAEVKATLSTGGVVATDAEVANFIVLLQGYAQAQTSQTYLVKAEAVTQKQVDTAQAHLDNLSQMAASFGTARWSYDAFNAELVRLFTTIPRIMKEVGEQLVHEYEGHWDRKEKRFIKAGGKRPPAQVKKQVEELIGQEQSNLDSMAGQVSQNAATQVDGDKKHTLLDSLGLKLVPVTDKKIIDIVKKKAENHAHKVKRVFAVENTATQTAFNNHLAKADNKKTEIFWHGSRRANWWSILQKGLMIRPSTAVYTGSMFGDGIYFASECDKSMGYTDGHRWTGGSRDGHVYMALYDVHIGKQYVTEYSDGSLNYSKIQQKGGYDSTWGKKGPSLHRHEYIIYKASQCTIKYIVEFEA